MKVGDEPAPVTGGEIGDGKESAADQNFRRQWNDAMEEGRAEEKPDQQSQSVIDQCLRAFRNKDAIMDVTVFEVLKRYIAAGGKPHVVVKLLAENYRGFAQMCNLMYEWLRAAGLSDAQIDEVAFGHVKALIVDKFDARKVDQIFEEEAPSAAWLEAMIAGRQWRSLIYQLSEQEKSCVLLQYAIQRISDAGHQDEIANLTTASAYFTVFNRVLLEYLNKLVDTDEDHLCLMLPDLKSEHTYIYVQVVLHRLVALHPRAEGLRRLCEELEAAQREQSPMVRKIGFQLSDIRKYPDLSLTLSNVLAAGEANPGDVITLETQYAQPEPPPLRFLRNPEVLEILVRDLFHPAKPAIDPSLLSRYFHLLSLISAAHDGRQEPLGVFDTSRVAEAQRVIQAAHTICRNNPIGLELQSCLPEIRDVVNQPLAAVGVLTMISANLLDKNYYSTTYATTSTPIYFGLLRLIGQKHATQHRLVLDLVTRVFDLQPELDPLAILELRKNLLDVLVFLMGCGCVLPVLVQVEKWAAGVDQALIRFFLHQLLDLVEPPYSADFVSALLRLMPRAITPESMRTAADTRDAVSGFVEYCAAAGYNLPEADKKILLDLRTILKG